ncbi:MAG: response regulator transcription factor [Chloroflexi bacterium]|nr:response regulator transcription factor [Chloroflexota bacterium]
MKTASSSDSHTPHVTPREAQVLGLLSQGLPNKEIAHSLSLSHVTVRQHVSRLLQKYSVQSRTELVAFVLTGERLPGNSEADT